MKTFIANATCDCPDHKDQPADVSTLIIHVHPDEVNDESVQQMISIAREKATATHGLEEATVRGDVLVVFGKSVEKGFKDMQNPQAAAGVELLRKLMSTPVRDPLSMLVGMLAMAPLGGDDEKIPMEGDIKPNDPAPVQGKV